MFAGNHSERLDRVREGRHRQRAELGERVHEATRSVDETEACARDELERPLAVLVVLVVHREHAAVVEQRDTRVADVLVHSRDCRSTRPARRLRES